MLLVRLLLPLLLLLSAATEAKVLFLVPEFNPSSLALMNKTMAHGKLEADIRLVREQHELNYQAYQAVVLVGSQVLEQWQAQDIATVSILANREQVTAKAKLLSSGIYAEPPLLRQIQLAKALLGEAQPLGILLPHNKTFEQFDTAPINPKTLQGINVALYYYNEKTSNLMYPLQQLLNDNLALIGVYDQKLYSPAQIKTILISAYRQNRPLIGPSGAYLKAGALATTYSDMDDTAKRLAEVLLQGLNSAWPPSDYNPYFHIGFNEQVARSLNIRLPQAESLIKKMPPLPTATEE